MKTTSIAFIILCFLLGGAGAQTILSGNISGTWLPSGNPYIITDNATVPVGQSLTIQPDVIVWIASGLSITVNGVIQAAGTDLQHITFQAPVNTQSWNGMFVNNNGANVFSYCDFANTPSPVSISGSSSSNYINHCTFSSTMSALRISGGHNQVNNCTFDSSANALSFSGGDNQVNNCTFNSITNTALTISNQSSNQVLFSTFLNVSNGVAMIANHNNQTLSAKIQNCVFSNCLGVAISGVGDGWAVPCSANSGQIVSEIRNCIFRSVSDGCNFVIYGNSDPNSGGSCGRYTGYGYGNVKIQDSIFNNVTNTAISLTAGAYALNSPALLINNVIANAGRGAIFGDPWDAKMENSIVAGCAFAVTVYGGLSRYVQYNDFFNNAQNFIGYPSAYGEVILVNRNGTPCDLLFNIYSDPLFASSNNFALQTTSPCIDAGEGSGANYDSYFPPSLGSVTNDIGAYGGPNAGGWFLPPPSTTNTFTLTSVRLTYVGVTINPPSAGHYRLEYSSAPVLNNWIQITNMDLSGAFHYLEPASSPQRFYRAVKLY